MDLPAKQRTCFIQNRLAPLKPKAVAFSRDGQFAAVSMGLNGTPDRRSLPSGGIVTVHRFDNMSGVIEAEPIAQWKATGLELAGADLCTFFPSLPNEPYRILVVDQGADLNPHLRVRSTSAIAHAGRRFCHRTRLSAWRVGFFRWPPRRGCELRRRHSAYISHEVPTSYCLDPSARKSADRFHQAPLRKQNAKNALLPALDG